MSGGGVGARMIPTPCAAVFAALRCFAALRESVGERCKAGSGGSAPEAPTDEPGRRLKLESVGVDEEVVIAY
jgi:hypothetical protein